MRDRGTKHCCQEDLLLYYYGELADQQRRELEKHLAVCEICGQEWRQLQRSLKGMTLPTIDLGPVEARDLPPGLQNGRSVPGEVNSGCGVGH